MVANAKLGRRHGRAARPRAALRGRRRHHARPTTGLEVTGRVPAGYLYVDGIVGDVGQGVLRDRRVLAEEGVVVVVATVDVEAGKVLTGPEIITRGWVLRARGRGPARRGVRPGGRGGRAGAAERCPRRRGPRARGPPRGRAVRQRAHAAPADDRARRDGGLTRTPADLGRREPRTEGGRTFARPVGTVRPWPAALRRRASRRADRPRARRRRACRGGRLGAGAGERCVAPSIPHRDDLIGLVVVVAGVLLGLAVYLRVAGPVGSGIDTGLGALVGVARYLLPVALLACGVALLSRRAQRAPARASRSAPAWPPWRCSASSTWPGVRTRSRAPRPRSRARAAGSARSSASPPASSSPPRARSWCSGPSCWPAC